MLPIEAIWQDVKARGLGAGDPVWWGERMNGDAPQTVVSAVETQTDADAARFARFSVRIASYHPDRATAEARALAIYQAYAALQGRSSLAPGLALEDWHAEQVQAELQGVIDALPITGGRLYLAAVLVTLVNLAAGS